MEKHGKNNQFRRMQELAGVVNEIEVEDLELGKIYNYNNTADGQKGTLKYKRNLGDTVEFEVDRMQQHGKGPFRSPGSKFFLAPAKVKAYISLHD